ncbi:hypothetical protein U9M48_030861 [Paspalum notatum var. saurae]|uniref:Protein FAR1-RELATED SEQUENCE n=1 Tax=Paspalum notatum var. saurae TaxID=547442 RepID=A0AAQ3X3R8_PASNO
MWLYGERTSATSWSSSGSGCASGDLAAAAGVVVQLRRRIGRALGSGIGLGSSAGSAIVVMAATGSSRRDQATREYEISADSTLTILARYLAYLARGRPGEVATFRVHAGSPLIEGQSLLSSLSPRDGMEFSTFDEAWMFWVSYGGLKGFEVRKRYTNKRKSDGMVRSCRFVCANEGYRLQDKRDYLTKCPRVETRTDCQVCMGVSLDKKKGKYKVSDLILEHNHILCLPKTSHLMVSQRKISDVQGFEIETADDTGIRPKSAHGLVAHITSVTHYVTTRIICEANANGKWHMEKREACLYKIVENPSFQYALQLDRKEQIANIFWVDVKMLTDYAYFGDVVSFDTTFGTNKESRPFGVFVGFNHFRKTIVFGAVLMYDETFESFKWLFETFLKAHNGKQPKTIYTDQDSAMEKAVKERGRTKYSSDFSACMYEYEDEATFEHAFNIMRTKACKQTWLDSIYKLKEKWAQCYMKDVYTLGMRSTQLSESLNAELKRHFKSDFDIIRFLKHFKRVVQDKRNNELNAEFESRKKLPRIKMRTAMLIQASKLYTPVIFEAFQVEYERSMAACTTTLEGNNEFFVAIGGLDENFTLEKEYKVTGDALQQTSTCSCGQFNRVRILYGHALKVFDLMNIKALPTHYVDKRWTCEARSGTVQDK